MSKPGNTGLKRIALAAFSSAKGFRSAWNNEAAFRQELLLSIVLAPLGIWLGQSVVEYVL
jgi:diacylglycerol kinase (ATP)